MSDAFWQVDGYALDVTDDELYELTLGTATSAVPEDWVAEWICAHLAAFA